MRVNDRRTLHLNILVALLYLGFGYASNLLTPQPEHAVGIWPPAGVAFVAVLCGGYRYLPGVFLGALLLNFVPLGSAATWGMTATTAIAAAVAAQAAFGAWLVRRFIGYPTALEAPRSILAFLLLAGPVACLLSASIATLALYQAEAIAWESVRIHWLTWWLGDTVGTILFGLIGLCLIGWPRTVWRPRRTSVAAPLLLAFIPAIIAIGSTGSLLAQRQQAEFRFAAEATAYRLENALLRSSQALTGLAGIFEGSQKVDREEFRQAANRQLHSAPAIDWVAWLPAGATGLQNAPIVPAAKARVAKPIAREQLQALLHSNRLSSGTPSLTLGGKADASQGWFVQPLGEAGESGSPPGFLVAPVDLLRIAHQVVPTQLGNQLAVHMRRSNTIANGQLPLLDVIGDTAREPFMWRSVVRLDHQAWEIDVTGLATGYEHSWAMHALITACAGIVYSIVLALLLLVDSGRRFRVERFFARIAQPIGSRRRTAASSPA